MYLFYVVDALDIKKIEKKNEYFCILRFFLDFYDFFPIFSLANIIPITITATMVFIAKP